jgi:CheY-like chemotaxis protein
VDLSAAKVLVVDDVPSNIQVAQGYLRLYKLEPDSAGSGEEAIAKMETNRYDLVFMDHMMPGMDGVETVRRLREGGDKTPRVVLTANALIGNDEMFASKGFDGFLSKPLKAVDMDKTLLRFIPREKQGAAAAEEAAPPAEPPAAAELPAGNGVLPDIDGLDTTAGLERTGGEEEGYRYVLNSFCEDSKERIDTLRHILFHFKQLAAAPAPADQSFIFFATLMHALKNALFSIGADALSAEAGALEALGRAADSPGIREQGPGFYDSFKHFVEQLGAALGSGERS